VEADLKVRVYGIAWTAWVSPTYGGP